MSGDLGLIRGNFVQLHTWTAVFLNERNRFMCGQVQTVVLEHEPEGVRRSENLLIGCVIS